MSRIPHPATSPHANRPRKNGLAIFCGLIVTLLITAIFFSTSAAQTDTPTVDALEAQQDQPLAIYFFWGDGCPHCAEAKPFLQQLSQQYPNVEVRAYEVWYDSSNLALFRQMALAYGFEPSGVPTIFIGDRYWVGYGKPVAEEIAATVAECSLTGCRDAGVGIIPGIPTPAPTNPPEAVAALPSPVTGPTAATSVQETASYLELPLIGAIELAGRSLVTSTALIAFVDGFNPCSLWVLSVLLALTLHTGSRKKIFWIGLVFLAVTSLFYMLFITGLFTIFSITGFLGWVQGIVALVALFFAVVNIKDYFWYKEGISFTIPDSKKPGIYRRMRAVLDAGNSMWGLIGATVMLAAGVSLVEFSCTAGFPLLWTNLLITQQATAATFVLLLLLYMLIYQLDELGIFLAAVFTLKATKLEEKQGRMLKLAGGMLMLTLAIVMLINPALMNSVGTSLLVFVIAFAATALVLIVHRMLLPRLGIYVGTELHPQAAHQPVHQPQHTHRPRKQARSRKRR